MEKSTRSGRPGLAFRKKGFWFKQGGFLLFDSEFFVCNVSSEESVFLTFSVRIRLHRRLYSEICYYVHFIISSPKYQKHTSNISAKSDYIVFPWSYCILCYHMFSIGKTVNFDCFALVPKIDTILYLYQLNYVWRL